MMILLSILINLSILFVYTNSVFRITRKDPYKWVSRPQGFYTEEKLQDFDIIKVKFPLFDYIIGILFSLIPLGLVIGVLFYHDMHTMGHTKDEFVFMYNCKFIRNCFEGIYNFLTKEY